MSIAITFSVAGKDAQAFKERIRDEATRQGLSMSEYLVEAIADHLRKQKEKPNVRE